MALLDVLCAPESFTARLLNPLQPLFALGARLYVSWQFLRSGLLKLHSWNGTLYLFENEYHVPWLPPDQAAVAGTFGELIFPSLLIIGLFGRLSALGLSVVNVVAVVAYSQVLLAEGSEAALAQHVLWGTLLLFLVCFGPGKLSLDYLLRGRRF